MGTLKNTTVTTIEIRILDNTRDSNVLSIYKIFMRMEIEGVVVGGVC